MMIDVATEREMKKLSDECTESHIVVYPSREEWLTHSPMSLGASELPSLVGHGYQGTSPTTVWERKVYPEAVPEMSGWHLRAGIIMEPAIRELYSEFTGNETVELPVCRFFSRDLPFLSATPDGIVVDADTHQTGVLELKSVSAGQIQKWDDGPPIRFLLQCQHQLAVTGLEWADLFGLTTSMQPMRYRIERDEEQIQSIKKIAVEFWSLVVDKVKPEIDCLSGTADVIRRLHPDDNGLACVLPSEFTAIRARLDALSAEQKKLKEEEQLLKNQVMSAIGDHTYGMTDDGLAFSWKTHDGSWREAYMTAGGRRLRRVKKIPKGVNFA